MTTVHRERLGTLEITTVVVGRWSTNCYVLRVNEHVAIVDPGAEPDAIIETVADGTVEHILFTHGHYDHVGAAAALSARYELTSLVHAADRALVGHAAFYAHAFDRATITTPNDVSAFDASPLALGGLPLAVIPCPGHTPGSVAFRLPGVVLSGDTLLREATGRTDLPGGDAQALRTSVERLLAAEDPGTLLRAGHGRPWEVGAAREWWAKQSAT